MEPLAALPFAIKGRPKPTQERTSMFKQVDPRRMTPEECLRVLVKFSRDYENRLFYQRLGMFCIGVLVGVFLVGMIGRLVL